MWPFEFTATPGTSPKFIPCGSLGKSGTESKAISGAVCWASAGPASSARHAIMNAFIGSSLDGREPLRSRFLPRLLYRQAPMTSTTDGRASSRMKLRCGFSPRAPALAPEDVKPGRDDDCGARECEEIRDIAEHCVAEHDRPHNHCVLVGHDHAGRRQFQRAVDAGQGND